MIKSSKITDEFAAFAKELFEEAYWSNSEKYFAAQFLNAAIEAGVVSPPVWAIRNMKTGEIIYERQNPKLTIDGTPTDSDVWEKVHWKGEEP